MDCLRFIIRRVKVDRVRIFPVFVILFLFFFSSLSAAEIYLKTYSRYFNLEDSSTYSVLNVSSLKKGPLDSPVKDIDYPGVMRIGSVHVMGNPADKKFIHLSFDFSDLPFISRTDALSRRDVKLLLVAHSSLKEYNPRKDFPKRYLQKGHQPNGIFGKGENFAVFDSSENPGVFEIKFSKDAKRYGNTFYPEYWIDIVLMLPPLESSASLIDSNDYFSTLRIQLDGGSVSEFKVQGAYRKFINPQSYIFLGVEPLDGHEMNLRELRADKLHPVADVEVGGGFLDKNALDNFTPAPELDLYISSSPLYNAEDSPPFLMRRTEDVVYVPSNSFPYKLKVEKRTGLGFNIYEKDWLSANQNQMWFDGRNKRFIRLEPKISQYSDVSSWSYYYTEYHYENRFRVFMKIEQEVEDRIPLMAAGLYSSDIYFNLVSSR